MLRKFFSLGGLSPWTVSDGGEVYSPSVGGKRFLKKFFSLGRLSPWRPPTVEKCTRRNVGGKRFLKNKFFSLGRRTPWRIPTISKCTFLLCGRKVPKRTHPSGGEPTDSPPLGIPPLPWGCVRGTCPPLPKSASGGKTPFGKLTASALILAVRCTATNTGQANH